MVNFSLHSAVTDEMGPCCKLHCLLDNKIFQVFLVLFAKYVEIELSFVQQVAEKNKDVQLTDFVESEFLAEQVRTVFMLVCFHQHLFFTVMAGQLNFDFDHSNCLRCRWMLSKRSQNMLLSCEEWVKDMVKISILCKVLPYLYLFMNLHCAFAHPLNCCSFFEIIRSVALRPDAPPWGRSSCIIMKPSCFLPCLKYHLGGRSVPIFFVLIILVFAKGFLGCGWLANMLCCPGLNMSLAIVSKA